MNLIIICEHATSDEVLAVGAAIDVQLPPGTLVRYHETELRSNTLSVYDFKPIIEVIFSSKGLLGVSILGIINLARTIISEHTKRGIQKIELKCGENEIKIERFSEKKLEDTDYLIAKFLEKCSDERALSEA